MDEYWVKTDIRKLPGIHPLHNAIDPEKSNKIGVSVVDNGEPVTLIGSVRANIIEPDGTTLTVDGSKSNNQAWVVLPDAVYSQHGQISVFLKMVNGSEIATLAGVVAYIP